MDRVKRIDLIKSYIALLAYTEEEAHEFIHSLHQEDWNKLISRSHKLVWQDLPCVICKQTFRCSDSPVSGICEKCDRDRGKTNAFSGQRWRAKKLNLPCSLTLREWHKTIEDFHSKCAYCLKSDYECLEHFVPIVLGGGTTKGNCVPACKPCNTRKKDRHPDDLIGCFPSDTIERIYLYLSQFPE